MAKRTCTLKEQIALYRQKKQNKLKKKVIKIGLVEEVSDRCLSVTNDSAPFLNVLCTDYIFATWFSVGQHYESRV